LSSARREGIGIPPSPLCAAEVLVANPIAPCAHALQHDLPHRLDLGIARRAARRIVAHHVGAHRRVADEPGDVERGAVPLEHREILGIVSKSQRIPARSTSSAMPSTCVRLRMIRSRSRSRHGAIVKPQFPMIAVVTPSVGDGEAGPVPGELRVVVGVVVDDAGHQGEAVGIERFARRAEIASDRGDPSCSTARSPCTGALPSPSRQQRVANDEIVHPPILQPR
jgi:hypothetical protein